MSLRKVAQVGGVLRGVARAAGHAQGTEQRLALPGEHGLHRDHLGEGLEKAHHADHQQGVLGGLDVVGGGGTAPYLGDMHQQTAGHQRVSSAPPSPPAAR
jgi:hypothetical protein